MYTYTRILSIMLINQLIAVHAHPIYKQLEPNHAYGQEERNTIIHDLKKSQFFQNVLMCDFDTYAKKHDITPERIVERLDSEQDSLSDDDIIRYVKYRLARRLQNRFAHLDTYGEANAPDTYLQFWRQHKTTAHSCDAVIENIVSAFCEHRIYIQQDMQVRGQVLAQKHYDRFEVNLYLNSSIAKISPELLHVIEHEITHIEQYISTYPTYADEAGQLYNTHPLHALNKSPRSATDKNRHQIESEADYDAAMHHPLAQCFSYNYNGNTTREYVDSNLPYLSITEYKDFLARARNNLSPSEQHRQNMLAYNIWPNLCNKASRSLTSGIPFIGNVLAHCLIWIGMGKQDITYITTGTISSLGMFFAFTSPHIAPQRSYNSYCVRYPYTWKARAAITCDRIITNFLNKAENVVSNSTNKLKSVIQNYILRKRSA